MIANRIAQNIKADILIVGGSYAGISALVTLKNRLRERQGKKVSVAIIEPKAGLLNILGVSRSLVDPDFAKTQFIPFENLKDISFDNLLTNDPYVQQTLGLALKSNGPGMDVTFIHGNAAQVETNSAQFALNGSDDTWNKIEFKYCVVAAGRNRRWPTTPNANNFETYMNEMNDFNRMVAKCKSISVVGAGAVGIEIAGEFKYRYPDIDVHLFHPHATFPPELLSPEFDQKVRESLDRAGVKVHTGLRVKSEKDGVLEMTTGEKFETDFTYWCNGFHNNTEVLGPSLARYISPKNNVYINDHLQPELPNDPSSTVENVFCVGDMMEIPGIKLAGLALYSGRQAATDIVSHIYDGKFIEIFRSLKNRPPGMAVVCGAGDIVSEMRGLVELNMPRLVAEYEDHRLLKVRDTIGA